ncbi:heterokaryon incompatibility protein-domain-containing protein [Stachybotrys elegans]|uniref:Heterokaryon incompatibility protein-domain-containing protein n=1 Tax=Stachybotrys elegans TaxID=80388 RepID=A0A8K0WJA9_9HYPO|nr:heterokaryon incompatibility protein-domain-containing protein [Stachybotrys elegans]
MDRLMDGECSIKLCRACQEVNFFNFVYQSPKETQNPKDPDPQSSSLGLLSDINDRAPTCDFCQLLITTAQERFQRWLSRRKAPLPFNYECDGPMPMEWVGDMIRVRLDKAFLCSFSVTPDPGWDAWDVNRVHAYLEPCPWYGDEFDHSLSFQPFWENSRLSDHIASHTEPGLYGSGRFLKPELDISRLQSWLHTCLESHGNHCERPEWLPELLSPPNLRLIDVVEECLVPAPEARYLALSYVWGELETGQRWERSLTKKKLEMASAKGGLLTAVTVPQAVKDAMNLTKRLGERYLWVDALCMVQDDEMEIMDATGKMDLVFGGAFAVIIAAAGHDATQGLPGIRPDYPRKVSQKRAAVASVPGCGTMSLMQNVLQGSPDHLKSSKWNSRGWTFQERLLARRAIIFLPNQVYWTCEHALCEEETHLEEEMFPSVHRPFILNQRLGCNDEWDDGEDKFTRQAFKTYIVQYMLRNFTYPADVLRAFEGIARRCSFLTGVSLHWGLNEDMFDQDLSFRASTSQDRDVMCQVECTDGTIAPVPYPTWSWMSWKGAVGAKIHNEDLYKLRWDKKDVRYRPLLRMYSLLSDGNVREITSGPPASITVNSSFEIGQQEVKGPVVLNHNRMYEDLSTDNSPTETVIYDTGMLVFWTSHAAVLTQSSDGRDSVLFIDNGDTMQTNARFDWSWIRSSKKMVDYIVIGRHYPIGEVEENGWDVLAAEADLTEVNKYRRVGCMNISTKDWERLKPTWKMIVLA